MPDKMRPVIIGLMDAGRMDDAKQLLRQEDAKWHALKEEVGERVIIGLMDENLACECGECGVIPPREYIFRLILQACGEAT